MIQKTLHLLSLLKRQKLLENCRAMATQIQSKGMVGVGSVWKIKNTEKVRVLPITDTPTKASQKLTYSETADSGTSAASSSSVVPAGNRKRTRSRHRDRCVEGHRKEIVRQRERQLERSTIESDDEIGTASHRQQRKRRKWDLSEVIRAIRSHHVPNENDGPVPSFSGSALGGDEYGSRSALVGRVEF